jgi:hypothetical protein
VFSFGAGTESCGKFILAVDGERRARPPNSNPDIAYTVQFGMFMDFADGFLTGFNYAGEVRSTVGAKTDHAGRMVWVENYCRTNPIAKYRTALVALRDYLASRGQ